MQEGFRESCLEGLTNWFSKYAEVFFLTNTQWRFFEYLKRNCFRTNRPKYLLVFVEFVTSPW